MVERLHRQPRASLNAARAQRLQPGARYRQALRPQPLSHHRREKLQKRGIYRGDIAPRQRRLKIARPCGDSALMPRSSARMRQDRQQGGHRRQR